MHPRTVGGVDLDPCKKPIMCYLLPPREDLVVERRGEKSHWARDQHTIILVALASGECQWNSIVIDELF
ncbi:hypothetical protein RRG08_008540 [Elysia crispata]|uniref:Uncharacterized protein n=1 Tax=Elysia crispata TaxID=231223 RepID=A0AAE0YEP4_9GAST|nr:hypothetical protein RRG08_008540 [Elysia crispata]